MRSIGLIIYALFLLYLGYGGLYRVELDKTIAGTNDETERVVVDDVEFLNQQHYLKFERAQLLGDFYPWVFFLFTHSGSVIVVFCAGSLGSFLYILKSKVHDNKKLTDIPIFTLPILSGILGIMILGISWALPSLLTIPENSSPNLYIVMFLSFLGGAFHEKTYKWVEGVFPQFFKTQTGVGS